MLWSWGWTEGGAGVGIQVQPPLQSGSEGQRNGGAIVKEGKNKQFPLIWSYHVTFDLNQ